MEKETENLPMEEENQDVLVDYDSEDSVVTVVERERDSEEIVRKDREEKEEKETEGGGTIPKRKQTPKVRENITLARAWAEDRPILPIGSRMLYEKQEKLITKMDAVSNKLEVSLKTLEKVMAQANLMMENMVEVAHINLEKERVKLRRLELEAETKGEIREKIEKPEIRAQRAAAEENTRQVKCYRCNRMGHMAKDCPLAESEAWFCYYCQEVRGHKGDSCPNAGAQASRFRGKRYLNKTVNKNVKKKGKFEQKGTKRVNNKGKITKIQNVKKPIPTKTANEGKSKEDKEET
ncbi:uncharacterized protein [Temnothorax nylanderi]|uniref:uncharacterized protein isoform X3 n=1 Tax=Temnothorax nylanderi TaxID=102681 RepID=UPI003A87F8F7